MHLPEMGKALGYKAVRLGDDFCSFLGTPEVAAINRHAAQLNVEMSDALSFQASSADE
jgi:hypothetical protein